MSLKSVFQKIFKKEQEKVKQFDIHGVKVNVTPSEKQFAQDLFDSLASIPTGRQAIEDMKKYKVDFFLETALGTAGGYFDPEKNQIVMAKSLGMDFMEFALVHEARHLLQNNLGRDMAEAKNLDYASRLMINRATEADAQTQAIKACKEWEAIGHDAPMKRFEQHYKPMVDAYDKNNSLSDAFKGWYDDERICASYEQGYDVGPCLKHLNRNKFKEYTSYNSIEPVSLKPADIKAFCGGDRVEGFEEFLDGQKARQVHLLTKTVLELYDEVGAANHLPRDPSLKDVPVRDLKDNPLAAMYANVYINETRVKFNPDTASSPMKKTLLQIAMRAIAAVEKINVASVSGIRNKNAEKELQEAKKSIHTAIKDNRETSLKHTAALEMKNNKRDVPIDAILKYGGRSL